MAGDVHSRVSKAGSPSKAIQGVMKIIDPAGRRVLIFDGVGLKVDVVLRVKRQEVRSSHRSPGLFHPPGGNPGLAPLPPIVTGNDLASLGLRQPFGNHAAKPLKALGTRSLEMQEKAQGLTHHFAGRGVQPGGHPFLDLVGQFRRQGNVHRGTSDNKVWQTLLSFKALDPPPGPVFACQRHSMTTARFQ